MPTSERPVALMTPTVTVWSSPNGIADGDGPLADPERVRIAEGGDRQLVVGLEADHRQVRLGVGAEDLAAVFSLVGEPHGDLVGALDDVEVGEDEAALVDDDAGARGRAGGTPSAPPGPSEPKN